MKYYLGLDNGGTTTKAALYDERGNEIASASVSASVFSPRPGIAERDMENIWHTNCQVISQVLQKSAVDPRQVACVAVCGHGKGLYLWGKGQSPSRNGIVSTDGRAWRYVDKWKRDGIEQALSAYTCQHLLPCQPPALLAWLREYEPDVLEKTQWIFECKDYIRFRLTGQAWAERSDYSGANLVNLKTGDYDERILSLLGLSDCADKLPSLVNATDLCGQITREAAAATGLAQGTPVAAGAFDINACAIALGVVDERYICMIAGTWSINEYLCRQPVTDGSVLMNSCFCVPPFFLVEECSATSAGNLGWFIETLLPELKGDSIYQTMDRWLEEVTPEEPGPIFLPFLMASNAHPHAMGSFVGVSSSHTRAHLVRSVYEGIVFSHRWHLEKLMKSRQTPPAAIRLAGGAACSKVWTQMFADILKLPIEAVDAKETGALGCAMIGATAIGDYANLAKAAAAMCRIRPAMQPNPALSEVYDKKYSLYVKTIEALDGVWDSFQAVAEEG